MLLNNNSLKEYMALLDIYLLLMFLKSPAWLLAGSNMNYLAVTLQWGLLNC